MHQFFKLYFLNEKYIHNYGFTPFSERSFSHCVVYMHKWIHACDTVHIISVAVWIDEVEIHH